MTIWLGDACDGALVPATDAVVPLYSDGVAYGLGCFETMRVQDGRVFLLDWHLARMRVGCDRSGIEAPAPSMVRRAVDALTAVVLPQGVGRMRLVVAAGTGAGVHVWATLQPLDTAEDGVHLVTSPWRRNPHSPLAGVKPLAYSETLLAQRDARRRGASDALLLNTDGFLAECATANVVVVREGRPHTPRIEDGALPGIGRRFLLADADGGVEETAIPSAWLDAVSEVFVVSALRGIRPVISLDGRALVVGPVTTATQRRWEERAAAEDCWT